MIEDVVANVIGEVVATAVRQAIHDATADKLRKKQPYPIQIYTGKYERVKLCQQWRQLLVWA